MDLNIATPQFPKPGETAWSLDYKTTPGGKGANQAMAAGLSGAKTALVGKVGDDGMGLRILNNLKRQGVMVSGVATSELPTGLAIVMRDKTGENQIVVAAGANADVKAEQVPDEILGKGNVLMMQMEVSVRENLSLMRRAKQCGALTMLNVAPARPLPEEALESLDYLIVNEIEAQQLGAAWSITDKDPKAIAVAMAKKGNVTCIVTLGGQGAMAVQPNGTILNVGAYPVEKVVDTAGAGDCFCGILGASLHEGMSLSEALHRASVGAGMSVMKKGIQDSYPRSGEVTENLGKIAPPK